MENFEKGAKRKCGKCGTLFFDFAKFPIVCPNCGADVNTLLPNVSKRGRPPKVPKIETEDKEKEDIKMEELAVEENIEDIDSDDSPVEDMIEIKREEE